MFVERLIRPAVVQAVALSLIGSGLPLRVFGDGWPKLEEFRQPAGGPIHSRTELANAVATSRALVHCWPERHAHPIEAAGRPLVRAAGKPIRMVLSKGARGPATWHADAGGEPVLSKATFLRHFAGSASRTIAA